MLRNCLIVVYVAIGAALAQNSTDSVPSLITNNNTTANSTTSQPLMMTNATTASTTTTTTTVPSSSSSSSSSSAAAAAAAATTSFGLTTDATTQEDCSACISNFQLIYNNQNYSSMDDHSIAMPATCPSALHPSNGTCFSFISNSNCSDVIKHLLTVNSNVSFGLTCSNSGIRVMRWTECSTVVENLIEDWNKVFCKLGNFSCFADRNGVFSMNKIEVLEPLRRAMECVIPVTTKAPIPLLPNPVGPGAITAIVVLVCLFIVAVLAGFFFWPKCHMAEIPVQTPKKKVPPPVGAFNVAYASPAASPTGAANVSIAVPPNQFARGPAAA